MVENKAQNTPENHVIHIYERINAITKEYGHEVRSKNNNKTWLKAEVVLNSEDNHDYIATLSSGYLKGESKLRYEIKKDNGRFDRKEYTFRQDGRIEKKVIRGISENGSFTQGRSLNEKNVDNFELNEIEALLSLIELRVKSLGQTGDGAHREPRKLFKFIG